MSVFKPGDCVIFDDGVVGKILEIDDFGVAEVGFTEFTNKIAARILVKIPKRPLGAYSILSDRSNVSMIVRRPISALRRLFTESELSDIVKNLKNSDQTDPKLNCKVVCIEVNVLPGTQEPFCTVGKIYEIVDGRFKDDSGFYWDCSIHSMEELNRRFWEENRRYRAKFIRLIED